MNSSGLVLNSEQINYDGILYPLPYRAGALQRAKQIREHNQRAADLYERVFPLDALRLDPIDVPLPFASSAEDQQAASQYFAHDPQLPLSIVTITRNDDHVERMAERTQAFIDCIYNLANRFQRRVELIIVEWNPPADRPPLNEAFRFPTSDDFVSTSIVTVSSAIHQRYDLADRLPLYQMIGKNVGIRRARGEFILATNIDVLLSPALFEHITGPALRSGNIYRGNRWDVDRRILDLQSPDDMLEQAETLAFQVNYPHATVSFNDDIPEQIPMMDYLGYSLLPEVHTMACGDFQLMHRDDWSRVRGYSEIDTFSFHLDSLFAVTCHFAGIDEINFGNDYLHFHIDHTLGTSVKNDSYVIENSKVMKHLSMAGLTNLARNMELQGEHYQFNKANWGLAGHDLPVHAMTVAGWETQSYQPQAVSTDTSPGALDCVTLEAINIGDKQMQQQHALLDNIAEDIAAFLKNECQSRTPLIWGLGHRARVFRRFLARHGVTVDTFVDSEASAMQNPDGTTVINKDSLLASPDHFVVVFSMHADDIRHQLNTMNLTEGRDYLVGF